MHQSPDVRRVEVVAAQPEDADRRSIAYLRTQRNVPLEDVLYLVKVYLDQQPPASGAGYALYVGDTPIPKYWAFDGGLYFNVYDPQFVADHAGQPLRFTLDREHFLDTGAQLPGFPTPAPARFGLMAANAAAGQTLPTKREALRQ